MATWWSSTYECASDVSPFHLRFPRFTPLWHLPWLLACGCVFVSVLCLVGFCVVLFPLFCFASGRGFLTQFLAIVLDDRQCFTARSAAR